MLNEFGVTVFPIIDEFGAYRLNGVDEFGFTICYIEEYAERKVSDSGAGTDSIPHIEIKVQDEGRCIA